MKVQPWGRARDRLSELGPWVGSWARDRLMRGARESVDRVTGARERRGPEHWIVAICDHFEPRWTGDPGRPGAADDALAEQRVAAWRRGYPALANDFRDSDGAPPRHTFFYPGEQYHPRLIEPLGELVSSNLAEVEVHLHHDNDTEESLTQSLTETLDRYAEHGLVPSSSKGRHFAFIHGNWCLANARPDGRHCGVDSEIELLYELGCYADFTFPSAPDPSQPAIVNSIYYPLGDVSRRRSYTRGEAVRVGTVPQDRVLLMQGPLALAWRDVRSPRIPVRIDAAALTAADPPTEARLRTWLGQRVHVRGRPEWLFLKLHTHGAPEAQARSLLGDPQRSFHKTLLDLAKRAGNRVHYVSAREMFNIARAAMDGRAGDPGRYRDYEIPPPERAARRSSLYAIPSAD